MRGPSPLLHRPGVRFLVELARGEGGRVSGAVSMVDGPATPFSGWLELLRLLEDGVDPQHRDDGVSGLPDAQEAAWDG